MKRVKIKVIGQVQGVNFRYSIWQEARDLGLVGWVKNLSDGSVEIEAEGEELTLKRLIDYSRSGPQEAKVKSVETIWEEPTGEYSSFSIPT